MYALEWQRLFGLAVALVMLCVAGIIIAMGPRLRANRRLGLFMIAEAVGLGAGWCIAQMALQPSHRIRLYEAAVESFGQDGVLTERERTALERMRARLGLSAEEVAHVALSVTRL